MTAELTSTDTLCPGECNAAFRRAEAEWEATGRDHEIPYHPGRPVWCESVYATTWDERGVPSLTMVHRGCHDRVADALGNIRRWLRDVPTSGPLAMAAPAERHGSASPPSPSPSFDERDALDAWLEDLTARLSARMKCTQPKRHRALEFAREHVTPLLSGPDAMADGLAILSWERRIRAIVGAQTVHRMPGTCPVCDARGSLRHRNGSDFIRCQSCSVVIEWDDYHRQIDDLADATPGPARRTA